MRDSETIPAVPGGRTGREAPEDRLYCFLRGGVEGGSEGLHCQVVNGKTICAWLDDDPEYLLRLKTL